jgi:valyl-tRNA synthetase
MDKTYNPVDIEQSWYQTWEKSNYFQPSHQGKPYCIMIPPPNVTGYLHMGHGFQDTLMDILTRYHRMLGCDTLWQVGTDHAGIATQMVVERQLLQEGKTRHDLGREAFVQRIWQWKQTSGGAITQQLRRMGASVDWSRERFTMDEGLSAAVKEVFIRLYKEGLIYRGKRLVNWDPKLLTAISDLEVVSEEEEGHLWYIRYPLLDGNNHITIATTRPETLLGDVAVAVHPQDERYQTFIGQSIRLPLTERTIPIIADDSIDPDFGTGCVKITPAHDFNDYAIGQRHQLPSVTIFTPEAKINDEAPIAYRGLDRYVARAKIVAELEALGLLGKTVSHIHKVPRGDRSGEIIEPYLTDQWFVKMQPLAEPAIAAVQQGHVQFLPENWTKTYYQWLENIEDWCISRQLWWGHRIPAWYDEAGNIYVADSEAEVRSQYHLNSDVKLTQDNDVLDTWFSSALWPFSTLGWPQNTPEYKTYYPTSVLVSGFDIIFFWIARMIMFGLKFTGEVPFKHVCITGLIRDQDGHKMSKSKGNVLDPIDLIDGIDLESLLKKRTSGLMQPEMAKRIERDTRKHFPEGIPASGTDALRFTYCALANTGRDIRFDVGRLAGYKNFCNKLWNAARYVLMNTEDKNLDFKQEKFEFTLADRYILSELQAVIARAHQYLTNYRFDLLAQCLYEFTWNEVCDWYLELSKPVLQEKEQGGQQLATRFTLLTVLETLLRLLHPIMPFITEEIWQPIIPLLGKTPTSIMIQPYPSVNSEWVDEKAVTEIAWVKQIILGVRNIRGEMNISPSKTLNLLLHKGSAQDKQQLERNQLFLMRLMNMNSITWLKENEPIPFAASALVNDLELLIPMQGLIDKQQESDRLQKEMDKIEIEIKRAQAKLTNPDFVARAPEAVVAQERQRVEQFLATKQALVQQMERIEAL